MTARIGTVGLAAVLTTAVLGARMTAGSRGAPPTTHIIEIREMAFDPNEVRARPGDTLIWVNRDLFPHTATEIDSAWTSPPIAPGESWRRVVDRGSPPDYLCAFHPTMEGRVTLTDPSE